MIKTLTSFKRNEKVASTQAKQITNKNDNGY